MYAEKIVSSIPCMKREDLRTPVQVEACSLEWNHWVNQKLLKDTDVVFSGIFFFFFFQHTVHLLVFPA